MQKASGAHPGVPEINPAAGLSVKVPPPTADVGGKLPLVMPQVNGAVPPKACIWPL